MKPLPILIALCGLGTAAFAAEVAPGDVVTDDYGAVESPLAGPGDPDRGAEVMVTRGTGNCIACHAVSALADAPWHGEVGPSLDGVGERWTEADLRGILVNAKNMFPGTIMPAYYKNSGYVRPGDGYTGEAAQGTLAPILTAQEVEDVVAFLSTLKYED